MNKVVLHATDMDGYLTDSDKDSLAKAQSLYEEAIDLFKKIGDTCQYTSN